MRIDTRQAPAYIASVSPSHSAGAAAKRSIPEADPSKHKGGFGEHLRREREMRGVSLDEIAQATRIGTRFLTALEHEQWHHLPGGVFNRGFVRSVSHFLGLNEESMVAEYELSTGQWAETPVVIPMVTRRDAGGRSRTAPWVFTLLLLVFVLTGWFAWHRYFLARLARQQSAAPLDSAAPTSSRPRVPASPPVGGTLRGASLGDSAASVAAQSLPLELIIAAGRTTRMKVVADGNSVFVGRMTRGRSERFRAKERLEISAENSSALLLQLNGQIVAPMGPPGRPGRITLTRDDLKKTPGGRD